MSDFFEPNPGAAFLTDPLADSPANDTATTEPGNNLLICDRTGFKVSVSTGLKREWTGRMVRPQSWEARHPLDFLRPNTREGRSGSPRPEQDDVFTDGVDSSGNPVDEALLYVLELSDGSFVTLSDGSFVDVYA